MTIARQIAEIFLTERFQSRVKEYLMGAPELKHESVIMTQLRIGLGLAGIASRREVRADGFRHDLRIGADRFIEAKYHYEGDIGPIVESLRSAVDTAKRAKIMNPRAYKTAERDMVVQAVRDRGAHWLLWMVLVRPTRIPDDYCFPNLIRQFYWGESSNLSNGVARAQALMLVAADAFASLRGLECPLEWLPRIETNNGTLLTLLVQLRGAAA
jgi:hypothetical protein